VLNLFFFCKYALCLIQIIHLTKHIEVLCKLNLSKSNLTSSNFVLFLCHDWTCIYLLTFTMHIHCAIWSNWASKLFEGIIGLGNVGVHSEDKSSGS
jgi:hypothetical protein